MRCCVVCCGVGWCVCVLCAVSSPLAGVCGSCGLRCVRDSEWVVNWLAAGGYYRESNSAEVCTTTGPNCYCSVDAVLAGVADHRGQDTLVNGSAAGGSTAADASNLVHRHFAGSARCLLLIVGLVPTVALLLYWLFDFRLSTFRLCRL